MPKKINIKNSIRDFLFYESEGRCVYCGNELTREEMTVDHIIPFSGCGPKTVENLVASCRQCNGQKMSRTGRDFRAAMPPRQRAEYDRRIERMLRLKIISPEKYELLQGRTITEYRRIRLHIPMIVHDIRMEILIRKKE